LQPIFHDLALPQNGVVTAVALSAENARSLLESM
jgi:hypothetical protein